MESRGGHHLKGSPNRGLAGATFGFFVGFTGIALIGSVGVEFEEAMSLSPTLLGLLVAAPLLSGSLLRIPFGVWADKVGGKKPLLTLLVLSTLGVAGLFLVLFYYGSSLSIGLYPVLLFLAVICGCGVATFSAGSAQTSYWFPRGRQGWALGVLGGLGNSAAGFSTLVIPFATVNLGLPGAYGAWSLFLVVGTVIYARISQDSFYFQLLRTGQPGHDSVEIARELGQELFPSGRLTAALRLAAKSWRNWALVALCFVSLGGFLSLTTWFPTYWVLSHGLNLTGAAVLTAVGFVLHSSLMRIWGGHLSDRFGGEKVALASYSLMLSGATVLMTTSEPLIDVTAQVVIGTGMGMANGAVFNLVARYVPEAVGGASGWVGGLGAFGGFALPPVLGLFVEINGKPGFALGFTTYVLLALMAIVITLVLRWKQPSS